MSGACCDRPGLESQVIVSVFYFAREKDLQFTLITLLVLVLLTLSLAIR